MGAGFLEDESVFHYNYHSEVVGAILFFNNEKATEKMLVNLLGLGLSHNSENETFIVLSPLSMVYSVTSLFHIIYT